MNKTDKTELLNRHAANAQQRVLLSHLLDQMDLAQRRALPASTGFLSPAEGAAAGALMRAVGEPRHCWLGGYGDAERRRCVFLPDWLAPEDVDAEEYVAALRVRWYAQHALTHRDLLGALMGLGLKREAVGDLLVSGGSADILLLPELVGFTLQNLESAGREKLRVEKIPLSALHIPVPRVKRIHATVPSLRLDAVAAAGFSLSRTKLAEAVQSGRVTVNWLPVTRADAPLAEGDVIACRGEGKCRLAEVGGLSRKGRVNVTMERFL